MGASTPLKEKNITDSDAISARVSSAALDFSKQIVGNAGVAKGHVRLQRAGFFE